jgi:hypothetical protein
MKRYLIFATLFFALYASGIFAFAQRPEETVASVPALDTFHEVIYQIWHEAYPKKDAAMLRKLLPDVEKGIANVASAPLPGILRDKTPVWDEGVRKLQSAGADYKAAAIAKDDAKLLNAAEVLHSRFEGLMRAIRPPLKELDEFHAVLYMLYHHILPDFGPGHIQKLAAELQQKMSALNEVQLPERLSDKDRDFKIARGLLSQSVDGLVQAVQSNDKNAVTKAVEAVHTNYQALEKIF